MEIDPKTGLPVEAIAWEDLSKEGQRIQISLEKRRYGKMTTKITGFDRQNDIKKIAKELKNKLACGGTYKNDSIELQGDHRKKAKEILKELGFDVNAIEE